MNRSSICLLAVFCLYTLATGTAVAQLEPVYGFAENQDGHWQATNRFHRFSAQITPDRIAIQDPSTPGGNPILTLELVAVSAGAERQFPGTPRLAVAGSRIERFFDGFSDWYINDRNGLKQGFTILDRPVGDSTSPLTLHFDLGGSLSGHLDPSGLSISFRNPSGQALYNYGGLVVEDATGQNLPSRFVFQDGQLVIRIDDSGATYPVIVDPLLTSTSWSVDGPMADSGFGTAATTAGDVNGDGYSDLLVGAAGWDDGEIGEGRAYLYLGSAGGLSASPSWTVDGNQAGAGLGSAVAAAGDVDGDGYGDILVSAPGYDGTFADEGRVFLYLGSSTGPSATADWTADGGQIGSAFGTALSQAGDVNGDGYDDIIVGAPGHDGTLADEGRAHLFLGSATGLAASSSWTADGGQAGAAFGSAVAGAGDMNGDGYADLAVGVPLSDAPAVDAGRIAVFLGSSSGPAAAPDWTVDGDQADGQLGATLALTGDTDGDGYADLAAAAPLYDTPAVDAGRVYLFSGASIVPFGPATWSADGSQTGELFGGALAAAGDINGDGYADLAIGAPAHDSTGTGEGRAVVYEGSATGLQALTAWDAFGDQDGAALGTVVGSAGDINGDGFGDVVVGAPLFDVLPGGNEGYTAVYRGAAGILPDAPNWHVEPNKRDHEFGIEVASADFNGDGYSDIVVGSPLFNTGITEEGRVYMYLGSPDGPATVESWTAQGNQEREDFGHTVSGAGDVNGDGFEDLLVGSPQYDNPDINEGRAYLFYGSAAGIQASPSWMAESDQAGALFGFHVSGAGDVNGDGYADIILGAPFYDSTLVDTGRAYAFFGSPSGPSTTPDWIFDAPDLTEQFGYSVSSAGDVNGDGYGDVIVGARHAPGNGRAYVFHGSATGLSTTPDWITGSIPGGGSYGNSVDTAGDVNRDGYSDVIVGAPLNTYGEQNEGRVFVYHGSASGLNTTAAWTAESGQFLAFYGIAVSTAGDVNHDGYSDIVVGAKQYDSPELDEGKVFIYLGSSTGLTTGPSWTFEADQAGTLLGNSVAEGGDVNGDGFSDLLIAGHRWANGTPKEGRADVFFGGVGGKLDRIPRQARADNTAPIAHGGRSESETEFRLKALGRTPAGRGKVRLVWEIKQAASPFDGTGLGDTPLSDTGSPGVSGSAVPFDELISGLTADTEYHWRVRLETDHPVFPRSPWISLSGRTFDETKIRTNGCVDQDGDGFGLAGHPLCPQAGILDCDDSNPAVYPGATEVCDGVNNDCDDAGWPDTTGGIDENVDDDAYSICQGDCNDADPSVNPGAAEITCDSIDQNCNGPADDTPDDDTDGITVCSDCDDADPAIYPGAPEICDGVNNDCDDPNWPDTTGGIDENIDGDAYSICQGDCNDGDPTINPGATEIICDGIDQNCNGPADDAADGDGDTFTICTDCDDTNPGVYPGAAEICDGVNNNCNDPNWPDTTGGIDENQDGDLYTICQGDCDDSDPAINPGATEIICDGIDQNCSGSADDNPDADGDTYAACDGDCNDSNPGINPGATEITCNSTDENCNGPADNNPDMDGDTYTACDTDCNDSDPAINSGAEEILCDSIDQNCNGYEDDAPDNDGDGYYVCNECDDTNPEINPGATEIPCNGIDENCNGLADDTPDVDGDTFTVCDGDCDDTDPAINPGATEITCNGIDENCNGALDDAPDTDGDTYSDCIDCDINDPAINPGATEITCNGIDENCNGAVDDAPDTDGDTYSDCIDCDINDPAINPGATEITCNGIDENCNGALDDAPDTDGDTYSDCIDCDINDPAINPGATEITCNGIDENCNGALDDAPDTDGDTYSDCIDCDINDPAINPGATEITCNGIDENCNGAADDAPDTDGDTYSDCIDCDINDPAINPGATEITCNGIDENCNGALDDAPDTDGDTYSDCIDCDINDPAINPGATEITCNGIDENCNGAVDDAPDTDGDTYSDCIDCDINDPAINPGATEITCNGIDENCNGAVDDAPDTDGDTYSDCIDCDINDPAINPGATEITCNGIDENCNGAVDDAPDTDGDTYSDCIDCDINDPAINPGATEITCNGIDENCNGAVDDAPDTDGDTYSDCIDCDINDPAINPGATEITCNGIDENCNGAVDDAPDTDGDTYSDCIDCDINDPAINPGATEITCNGIDENCNGAVDDAPDTDGDTYSDCIDCDINDPAINPGATEITCNGIDENCNGALDDAPDTDGDTYSDCIDCDINDPAINPGATEITCNGIDENCNGAVDDAPDTDGDTYSDCIDCDINDPAINPGATEITCNGIDENCNGALDDDPDADGDGVSVCSNDCNDSAGDSWAIPGEVINVKFGEDTGMFTWEPPAAPGGNALLYDVIRSSDPADFLTAAICIETDDGIDAMALDTDDPGSQVFYYLVRAQNACPAGEGPLGDNSAGAPRTAATCP